MSSTVFRATAEAADPKPRLIVLTDIGGDPDDQQSMVRLMVYSNEFEIEGLIASASGTPGELKEAVTRPQSIGEIVDAYGQVRGNLAQRADGYPSPKYLQTRIKAGNPQRGRDAIGEGRDTEGSRWIIWVVDRPDPRPSISRFGRTNRSGSGTLASSRRSPSGGIETVHPADPRLRHRRSG